MNVWKLESPQRLVANEEPVPEPEEGKIRTRVTRVLITEADLKIFRGAIKTKYPVILGRFAIGQISSQTENAFLTKGTRVLYHTYRKVPDLGVEKKDFSENEVDILGYTKDGFLRDFVNVGEEEITPLPDSVTDNDALLVHCVAIAKAAVDRIDAKKGDHVAVVGADLIGILICLLLIYEQASPVLVDDQPQRLYFARKCGVYYTMLKGETLLDDVAAVTGGRLCEHAVFVTSADEETELAFSLCARGGGAVFCSPVRESFTVNMEQAIRKQLSVYAVSDPEGSLETAINLVVGKAINLDPIRSNIKVFEDTNALFSDDEGDAESGMYRLRMLQLL